MGARSRYGGIDGGAPMVRRLLERIAQPEQVRLVIGQHHQFQADRNAVRREARGQTDRRQPCLRRDQRVGRKGQGVGLAGADVGLGRRIDLDGREADGVERVGGDEADDQALEFIARGELAIIVRIVLGLFRSLEHFLEQVEHRMVFAVALDRLEAPVGDPRTRREERVDVVPRVG